MDVDQANQYVLSGLDSTHFKIVRSPEELDDPDNFFHPDMCHQVFGENETIFGYRNLRINIFYDAITFQALVKLSYEDKIQGDDEQVADNLIEKLKPWLPDDYYVDETDFMKYMNNRKVLKPFGEKLSSFKCGSKREFEVYTCTSNEPNYQDFHQRMETLIVWYIDAANYIDIEDEKWRFFILYEKVTQDATTVHYPVGYSTVYEYYCYPASRRYRISQFIVFPPYQCMGLGTELLKNLYKYLDTIENINDITVEDPSEQFQSIRDYVDCSNCSTLPSFQLPKIKGDFSKEMINESREKFKINEKQCRRVYEILRLLNTDENNEQEFRTYKMLVKNRLNAPYKKQEQQNSKISKLIRETPQLQPDQRLRILEKDFQSLMKSYHHIIYRLKKK